MKLFIAGLVCAASLLGFSTRAAAQEDTKTPAQQQEMPKQTAAERKLYGEYPLGYRAIIEAWLQGHLIDPESARIIWDSEPKPDKIAIKGQRPFVGYSVMLRVNSRNRFGMYTGNQPYRVLIRNGTVMHFDRGPARR
jgi:hypothetical protein